MKTVKEKMILENRDISFDIFRSLIITSAIVLHFNNRFTLGVFAYPFRFINSHLFNVGNFFFFTAGYMGYLNYYKNNKRNIQYDSIKSIKKGFYILFVYCSFVTFMKVLTNSNIPNNFFDFFWNHRFYAKVLVTFSFVYIMSPVILKIFKVNKIVSIILFIIAYLVYVQNYSMENSSNNFLGIFFGIGYKSIYYPFVASLIVYCFGFYVSFCEHRYNVLFNKKIGFISMLTIILHSILIVSYPEYKEIIHFREIWLLITSCLIVAFIITLRWCLSYKKFFVFLNSKNLTLIGVKSLSFYVISNLFLGFILVPENSGIIYNFIVLAMIFTLSYIFTKWHYYSDFKIGKIK